MAEKAKPAFRPEELDPELISLKRKTTGPGPVLAIAVFVLCVYQLVSLGADFGFALTSNTPVRFGGAAEAYAAGKVVPDNVLVAVDGAPDVSAPGWLRGKQAVGFRLAPILGTSGRLWIQVTDDIRTGPPVYDLTWIGRSRRLDDLPVGDELMRHVRTLPPSPRVVSASAVGTAAGGAPKADVFGDELAPAADALTVVDERVAGVALITVYATDTVKDAAAARAGLVAAGVSPAEAMVAASDRSWTFEAPAPDGPAALRALISRAGFRAALGAGAVTEKIIHHETRWGQLGFDGVQKAIKLPDGRALPAAQVARLTVWVAPNIADDARVVIVGESPRTYWYLLPLFAVLGLVAVFMVWAFVRALKREAPPQALPHAPGPAEPA